jgi:hypothetical protein
MQQSAAPKQRSTAFQKYGPVKTVIVGFFLIASVYGVLEYALRTNWVIALVVALFYSYAAWLGIRDLRSADVQQDSFHRGATIAALSVLVASTVCACISAVLAQIQVGTYEPAGARYGDFIAYYLWVFADMIPGLAITKTLEWTPQVKPHGTLAGFPVLVFRAFILFGFLKALRAWWQARARAPGGEMELAQP